MTDIEQMRAFVAGLRADDKEVVTFASSIAHYLRIVEGLQSAPVHSIQDAISMLESLTMTLAGHGLCASMGVSGWAVIRPIEVG